MTREIFILSGEATIEVDGRRQVLQAYEGLQISPGQAHIIDFYLVE